MKRTPINSPVDQIHAECLAAQAEIRKAFNDARRRLGLPIKEEKPDQ